MSDQFKLLPFYLGSHINLTLIALFFGVLISVPLGVLSAHWKKLERISLGFSGVIQTVPGIALLAAMVPLLAFLGLPSIGEFPALLALVLYSLLPILRNTIVGIQSVDPAYIEAAKGVGMTNSQRLFKVELPLAQPMIIAGIRTATVWTVGMATLATPVGATSLGNFIFVGLQTRNTGAILIGCLSAALLAIILDYMVKFLENSFSQGRKIWLYLFGTSFLIYLLYILVLSLGGFEKDSKGPVVIGGLSITEGYVMAEILAEKIRKNTSDSVKIHPSLSNIAAFEALDSGDIDAYVGYTGTIWAHLMKEKEPPASRGQALVEIKSFLARKGLSILATVGFDNMFAFAIKRNFSEQYQIETLSDLARHKNLVLGGDYEFFDRHEWKLLRKAYGLYFKQKMPMDHALMYQAINEGNIQVAVVYTTDGHIEANDLVVLEDDRNIGLSYESVVLVNNQFKTQYPKASLTLKSIQNQISDQKMRELNFLVDSKGLAPAKVARNYLSEESAE